MVSVVDTYQYEDPQDIFSREPFILRVSAPRTSKCREGGDSPQPLLGSGSTGGCPWGCGHVGSHLPLPAEAGEFVMVPLHSAPHDAAAEIDALYDVYLAVLNKWGTDVSTPSSTAPWARVPTPR